MNNALTKEQTQEAMTGDERNAVEAMETEISQREPMSALEKLKSELVSKRNLDVGFETTDFDINNAITMVMELDKFTKISVLNSVKFFLNMQCIRQALRIIGRDEIEKTAEGRDIYDHMIAKQMDEYEKEGDYTPTLPAFIALNELLRTTMYDDMLEPSTMESTLEFMTKNAPTAESFEKDYDERIKQGMRPGISKREFCLMQLEDAIKQHRTMAERGQAAIQFCEDLNVHQDRGFGDLPDWAVDTIYNKIVDKLAYRWAKLDIRRTGTRTKPTERTEAEADQTLIEFVYKELTGREFVTEY
jgi:hypothetical protein